MTTIATSTMATIRTTLAAMIIVVIEEGVGDGKETETLVETTLQRRQIAGFIEYSSSCSYCTEY